MELYIESLTGTCFELIVSPYETILSVKTKIQRLEGIPISQQYLIWQDSHLEDDCCLRDYGITSGCTLKLVLAMRGGPINTRRVEIDDENLTEMANYIESSQEDLFGKLSPPPSCPPTNGKTGKQVTLLVYRDGDQLNFFRVVDRGDGTLTPFSESFSDSTLNPRDDDDVIDDDVIDDLDQDEYQMIRRSYLNNQQQTSQSTTTTRMNMAKIFENNITANKMKQVRNKMKNLSLINTDNNTKFQPHPPPITAPDPPVPPPNIPAYSSFLPSPPNLSTPDPPDLPAYSSYLPAPPSYAARLSTPPTVLTPPSPPTVPTPSSPPTVPTPPSPPTVPTPTQNLPAYSALLPAPPAFPQPPTKEKPNKPAVGRRKVKGFVNKSVERQNENPSLKDSTDVQNNRIMKSEVELTSFPPPPSLTSFPPPPSLTSFPPPPLASSHPEPPQLIQPTPSPPPTIHDSPKSSIQLLDRQNDENSLKVDQPIQESTSKEDNKSNRLSPGLMSNRHDLYLRKYGLIQSPTKTNENEKLRVLPPVISSRTNKHKTNDEMSSTNKQQNHDDVIRGGSEMLRVGQQNQRKVGFPPPLVSSSQHRNNLLPSITSSHKEDDQLKQLQDRYQYLIDENRRQDNKLTPIQQNHPISNNSTTNSSANQQQGVGGRVGVGSSANQQQGVGGRVGVGSSANQQQGVGGRVGVGSSKRQRRKVIDFINSKVDPKMLHKLVSSPTSADRTGENSDLFTSGMHETSQIPRSASSRRQTSLLQRITTSSEKQRNNGGKIQSLSPVNILPTPTTKTSQHKLLPPVKTAKKRCWVCGKRTGLATSYICRCGHNFCSSHRYAETHSCTYDYKSAGRKVLEATNPLVRAPKLPKI